jgi:transposase-like protein
MKKNQKNEVQRFSARRKVEIVLRVLKGESLDELSRELGVPACRLSEWRDEFLRAGETSMKTREPNALYRTRFLGQVTGLNHAAACTARKSRLT